MCTIVLYMYMYSVYLIVLKYVHNALCYFDVTFCLLLAKVLFPLGGSDNRGVESSAASAVS